MPLPNKKIQRTGALITVRSHMLVPAADLGVGRICGKPYKSGHAPDESDIVYVKAGSSLHFGCSVG